MIGVRYDLCLIYRLIIRFGKMSHLCWQRTIKLCTIFPVLFENNSTENDNVGMFDSVEAVGFQDIDGDGAKDVIVIINYVTGAGPQGMMPRKTIRIFSSQDNGFVISIRFKWMN